MIVIVLWLFLTVSCVGLLQCVNMVFLDRTHLLFFGANEAHLVDLFSSDCL